MNDVISFQASYGYEAACALLVSVAETFHTENIPLDQSDNVSDITVFVPESD